MRIIGGKDVRQMGQKKKTYTAEFKQQAVALYRRSDTSYSAIARELGVDPGSVASWVKAADGKTSSEENPFQVKEDNRRLQKENARLKEENEILLKASAFFASKNL